jgi:hypothetical protein
MEARTAAQIGRHLTGHDERLHEPPRRRQPNGMCGRFLRTKSC